MSNLVHVLNWPHKYQYRLYGWNKLCVWTLTIWINLNFQKWILFTRVNLHIWMKFVTQWTTPNGWIYLCSRILPYGWEWISWIKIVISMEFTTSMMWNTTNIKFHNKDEIIFIYENHSYSYFDVYMCGSYVYLLPPTINLPLSLWNRFRYHILLLYTYFPSYKLISKSYFNLFQLFFEHIIL